MAANNETPEQPAPAERPPKKKADLADFAVVAADGLALRAHFLPAVAVQRAIQMAAEGIYFHQLLGAAGFARTGRRALWVAA